jgi:acetyltransferase-like isoleucine patch superfamily enzyme
MKDTNLTIPAKIGKDCIIEKGVIVGYANLTKLREGYKLKPTIIGDRTIVRSGAIIYAGCKIGSDCHIGHNTVVREFTTMEDHSSLGSNVVVEGYVTIGHHSIIHAQTHITAKMTIGNYVFIGPNVTTANDRKLRYHRSEITEQDEGPTIEDGVVIGAGAHILPKVQVGMGAFVAMGALVTKDVRPWMLVMGVPAKEVHHVDRSQVVDELQVEYSRFIAETYFKDVQQ